MRVVLTRTTDTQVPLESRAATANQNKGDLFVSLHVNSAAGAGARGAETFFLESGNREDAAALAASAQSVGQRGGDPLFDLQLQLWDLTQRRHLGDSRTLAGLIQEELNTALGGQVRRPRPAALRLLKGLAMPAVLVELGFLSHPEEAEMLQDPEHRFRLADAVVKGISRYRAQVEGLEMPVEDEPRSPAP